MECHSGQKSIFSTRYQCYDTGRLMYGNKIGPITGSIIKDSILWIVATRMSAGKGNPLIYYSFSLISFLLVVD